MEPPHYSPLGANSTAAILSRHFSSQMLAAKQARKLLEGNATLLQNRIAQMKLEEEKLRRKAEAAAFGSGSGGLGGSGLGGSGGSMTASTMTHGAGPVSPLQRPHSVQGSSRIPASMPALSALAAQAEAQATATAAAEANARAMGGAAAGGAATVAALASSPGTRVAVLRATDQTLLEQSRAGLAASKEARAAALRGEAAHLKQLAAAMEASRIAAARAKQVAVRTAAEEGRARRSAAAAAAQRHAREDYEARIRGEAEAAAAAEAAVRALAAEEEAMRQRLAEVAAGLKHVEASTRRPSTSATGVRSSPSQVLPAASSVYLQQQLSQQLPVSPITAGSGLRSPAAIPASVLATASVASLGQWSERLSPMLTQAGGGHGGGHGDGVRR